MKTIMDNNEKQNAREHEAIRMSIRSLQVLVNKNHKMLLTKISMIAKDVTLAHMLNGFLKWLLVGLLSLLVATIGFIASMLYQQKQLDQQSIALQKKLVEQNVSVKSSYKTMEKKLKFISINVGKNATMLDSVFNATQQSKQQVSNLHQTVDSLANKVSSLQLKVEKNTFLLRNF